MADAGVPVHVLRKIAGHGSLTTTQRYLHPDQRRPSAAPAHALTAHLTRLRGPQMVPQAPIVRLGPRARSHARTRPQRSR